MQNNIDKFELQPPQQGTCQPFRIYGPRHPDGNRYAALCEISQVHPEYACMMAAAGDMLEALVDLLGDQPDVQGGICQHCGRDYLRSGHDDMLTGDCPADDCPAYGARAAIAKARGQP
jgi:hypothetical protein